MSHPYTSINYNITVEHLRIKSWSSFIFQMQQFIYYSTIFQDIWCCNYVEFSPFSIEYGKKATYEPHIRLVPQETVALTTRSQTYTQALGRIILRNFDIYLQTSCFPLRALWMFLLFLNPPKNWKKLIQFVRIRGFFHQSPGSFPAIFMGSFRPL